MTDITDTIVETNSRLDTIESNVVSIGKEIGMLQDSSAVVDLSTAVNRSNTEIDKINTELDNARIQVGEDNEHNPIMSTLDQRLDGIDYTISHAATLTDNTTGMAQHIAALETEMSNGRDTFADIDARFDDIEDDIDALETTVNATTTGLVDRVGALETTVDTANTGLSDRMTSAEGRLTTIEDELDNARVQIGTD